MAGAGYKSFTPSSLTSDEVNTYLMQQSVMVFATSAARSTAVPVPTEGMVSYLKDTDSTQFYSGSEWVAFITQNNDTGFRNAIINGGFDIWQRGTNYTTAGGGYGSADRWYSGFATGSFTQQPFTVGLTTITGYEPEYFGRWTISSNSQNYELLQKIEGVRSFAGQKITISFWARQTSGTVSVNGRWVQYFGTGGSPSASVVTNFVVPLVVTGSWVRYQYTMTVPTLGSATVGTNNDDSCWLAFQVVNTATGSLDFWGVQVESGSQATRFEQRPIGVELDLCFRYYQRMVDPAGVGVNSSGNATRVLIPLYTKMRAQPTSTMSGTVSFWNGTTTGGATAFAATYNSVSQGQIDFAGGVGSSGQANSLYTTGGSQYIDFSAEL